MMMDHMDGTWAVFGMAMMIAFWVGLIALAIWAIESFRPRGEQSGRETPLEIARRRYAAGEIGREEFEQIARDLGSPRGTPA